MIHQVIGWIGAILFAICAIPQVIKTWRTRKVEDLSWFFLLFWAGGELLTFTYVIIDDLALNITHYPLYLNYSFNTIMVIYLVYAKKKYGKNTRRKIK
jgi:uncharacterized protein with PQ loop repeat